MQSMQGSEYLDTVSRDSVRRLTRLADHVPSNVPILETLFRTWACKRHLGVWNPFLYERRLTMVFLLVSG
jgi:hypothetical protein